MAGRRGQITIDRVVAVRSTVLQNYLILRPDGSVSAMDQLSDDGNDFLTTRMHGEHISFQSIQGHYLSAEADVISTRSYCGADEKFLVVKKDTQYAFQARSGKYLSIVDRAPYITVSPNCDETETFQLFSLMMHGVNVGKQLELLEKNGEVMIESVLAEDQLAGLRADVKAAENGFSSGHETRVPGLVGASPRFAEVATHPLVMQIVRRSISPVCRLSGVESCRTDADFVRKELEETSWGVVHPYASVQFPGIVDARVSLSCTWFLDDLNASNSTWAWLKPPLRDGDHSPQLPQFSSAEDLAAVVQNAKPLHARSGAVWLYLGPVWTSNNIGAASFWKDFDAQTRYKHMSGQIKQDGSFRALTNATSTEEPKEDMCPTLLQATYIREYLVPKDPAPAPDVLAAYGEQEVRELSTLLA